MCTIYVRVELIYTHNNFCRKKKIGKRVHNGFDSYEIKHFEKKNAKKKKNQILVFFFSTAHIPLLVDRTFDTSNRSIVLVQLPVRIEPGVNVSPYRHRYVVTFYYVVHGAA